MTIKSHPLEQGLPNLSMEQLSGLHQTLNQHAIVSITDVEGDIIHVNDKFCEISGYSRRELLGQNHRIVKSDAHPPAFFRKMWETISNGETWQGLIQNRRKNGEPYWVQTTIMPMQLADGTRQYVSIRTEVSERIHARRDINRFKRILDQTLDSIFIFDVDTMRFTYANQGAMEQVGYSRYELMNMSPLDIKPEMDEAHFQVILNSLMLGMQDSATVETVHRHKSGARIPVEIFLQYFPAQKSAHTKGNDAPARGECIAIVRDISERQAAEATLARRNAELQETLERIGDGFFSLDQEWRFTYLNRAAEEILQTTWDEVEGESIWDELPEVASFFFRPLRQAMTEQMKVSSEGLYAPLNRWLGLHIYPSADGVSVYLQDITERRRLDEEKELLAQRMQQAQKMEAVGQLTAGIAHDFNNILASILGYADLALMRCTALGETKLQEYLTHVNQAGERARDLIVQMLAYSRGGEGFAGTPLKPASMVKETVKMLQSTLPSRIQLQLDCPADLPAVVMEPVKLQQLVMNLCINARDSIDGDGEIKVSLSHVQGMQGVCSSCQEKILGEYLVLSVQDNGAGMKAEVRQRLFEPFFTTKQVGKGTGLGLSVVHGIIHEHGGHILVESVPGQGTVFRLLIPAITIAQLESGEHSLSSLLAAEDEPAGEGQCIYVVDDESVILGFLQAWLKHQGYQVRTFSNSQEALSHFNRDPRQVDLLISDQNMPGFSGVALAAAMLEQRPQLPVILCSGYAEQKAERQAQDLGIEHLLNKPFKRQDLLVLVKELLDEAVKVAS